MSIYICPYLCSYRTPSGFCGYTGGYEACQYRRINGFDYGTKRFYAEPVKTSDERYVCPKKTNYDRIRAMTVEELAEAFRMVQRNQHLDMPWEEWLRQEVTENERH